ncbi:hypothetical protein [Rhodopseudomonas sp.]|uniref:hypothetical protein n=1 Tax=Rhodopseudomonas sp. TaxID=1078 RepID=UPI003B3B0639
MPDFYLFQSSASALWISASRHYGVKDKLTLRFPAAMVGRMVDSFFGADELQASGQTGRVAEKQKAPRGRTAAVARRIKGERFLRALPFVVRALPRSPDCISLGREML